MAWKAAKARIAELLATVEISEPVALKVRRVYEFEPSKALDQPCFVVYTSVARNERGTGLRTQEYVARMRLLVHDAQLERALELCEAFRSRMLGEGSSPGIFDSDVTLNGTCVYVMGPTAEEPSGFEYGGERFAGIDFVLRVLLQEGIAFAG